MTPPPPPEPSPRAAGILARLTAVAVVFALLLAIVGQLPSNPVAPPGPGAAADGEVRILATKPVTLDPGRQGDLASAALSAQLFETLTAFDSSLAIRPALARSWTVTDGGRRVDFTLRDGLTFSDGSPLTAGDVVESWLRLLDPASPSPLASLLDDVAGARDYRLGRSADAQSVGISTPGPARVQVRLDRPASDFVAIVAGPAFGIVPAAIRNGDARAFAPGTFVGSGGYVVSASTSTELTLKANNRYWAGTPAVNVVHVLTSIGGRSPVDAFAAGDLDYAAISDTDAGWIEYDASLGSQLRRVPSFGTTFYGFDTSRPPFDDVRVRRAIGMAVDWRRIVTLGSSGSEIPANGMVPAGIPGRPDGSFLPPFDPAAARALLAEAKHPGGQGLGPITMLTSGLAYDDAIAAQLKANLGLDVRVETMDFDPYQTRLTADPPQIWAMSWIADYPGANDFLGVLLESDASNNYGRWHSPEFDAAIEAAGRATSAAAATNAFKDAASIVTRDVPVVPVSTGTGWALSRTGLLGAGQNGLGIVRFAGLAWQGK